MSDAPITPIQRAVWMENVERAIFELRKVKTEDRELAGFILTAEQELRKARHHIRAVWAKEAGNG